MGCLQPLLLRMKAALEVGGRGRKRVLGPPAVLRAHPAPRPGGEGRVAGLGAQGAGLPQVGAQQHPAAAAPLVGPEQPAEPLLGGLNLLQRLLLDTTGDVRAAP